jgi:hypothetical protein
LIIKAKFRVTKTPFLVNQIQRLIAWKGAFKSKLYFNLKFSQEVAPKGLFFVSNFFKVLKKGEALDKYLLIC